MPLLELKNLKKSYLRGRLKAVNGVSLTIESGRTLGILGESGCGKSTLAKLALRLIPADEGQIIFEGRDITRAPESQLTDFRKKVQVIFQEPLASLDPRWRVQDILKEPFWVSGQKDKNFLEAEVEKLLKSVDLPLAYRTKLPHQLSGGECQRVAIARAISTKPALIICDEAVSSLDVIVQAQTLNLLLRLQKEHGIAYLFISHDLKVVRHMSDTIAVMKDGLFCETGSRDRLFDSPTHAYTKELMSLQR